MKNEDLKELLEANFTAVRAEMKADRDITNIKLDEMIGHQKETNGRVGKLECKVRKNTTWRLTVTAVASFVVAVIGFALLQFQNIKEFFK